MPLPLANLKPWKIRILKKWKKLLEISSFYIYVPKTTIIDLQFQRYRVRRTKFFVIFSHFLPFYNPNNLKNQNFASGDVIISHRRTKNHDHDVCFLRCGAWQKFLPFWATVCPFINLTTWKIKILKKRKKSQEISFYTCVPQTAIIWYMVPEIWCAADRIFSQLEPFYTHLPP